jgi:hypothetical protein
MMTSGPLSDLSLNYVRSAGTRAQYTNLMNLDTSYFYKVRVVAINPGTQDVVEIKSREALEDWYSRKHKGKTGELSPPEIYIVPKH